MNELKKTIFSTDKLVDLENMRKFITATELYRKIIFENEREEFINFTKIADEIIDFLDSISGLLIKTLR